MGSIHIGTSGYNYKGWKEKFYPIDLPTTKWLSYYAKHFKTVEINATFYGSFGKHVYTRWASQTSEDFTFAIKGSRFITHIKRLKDVDESLNRFFESASGLGEKLSVVLWQFPYSFKNDAESMEVLAAFLDKLPSSIHHVFEFRHKTWFTKDLYALLRKHKMGFVISESSRFPMDEIVTSGVVYIRFHGPTKLYASSYTDEQLQEWAKKIKRYQKKADVYCYFNNDISGYAIDNAKALYDALDIL